MSEHVFYDNHGLLVTAKRVVCSGITYPLGSVNKVAPVRRSSLHRFVQALYIPGVAGVLLSVGLVGWGEKIYHDLLWDLLKFEAPAQGIATAVIVTALVCGGIGVALDFLGPQTHGVALTSGVQLLTLWIGPDRRVTDSVIAAINAALAESPQHDLEQGAAADGGA